MNPNLQTVVNGLTDLARFAVVAYGIHATRQFLIHWLDTFPRRVSTPIEEALDIVRKNGFVLMENGVDGD